MGFVLSKLEDVQNVRTLTLSAGGIYARNSGNTAWEVRVLGTAALLNSGTTAGTLPVIATGDKYPAIDGSLITSLNASALGSGTAPTARLGSGTASSSTYLRGDQTWAAAGGANPAGSGTELQYRSSGTAFAALAGSSVSGSNLTLPGNVRLSASIPIIGFSNTGGRCVIGGNDDSFNPTGAYMQMFGRTSAGAGHAEFVLDSSGTPGAPFYIFDYTGSFNLIFKISSAGALFGGSVTPGSINTATTSGTVAGQVVYDASAGANTGHAYVWNGSAWKQLDN